MTSTENSHLSNLRKSLVGETSIAICQFPQILFFLAFGVCCLISPNVFSVVSEQHEIARGVGKLFYAVRLDASDQAQRKRIELQQEIENAFPKRSIAYLATIYTTVEDCCFDPAYALKILEQDAQAGNTRSRAVLGMFLYIYLRELAEGSRLAKYPEARTKIVLPPDAKARGWALIQEAADLQDPLALYFMGSGCATGSAPDCAGVDAKRLLERSADFGFGLGASMRAGFALDREQDRNVATNWAMRGEKLGDPEASWLLYRLVAIDNNLTLDQKKPMLFKHAQTAAFKCHIDAEIETTRAYLSMSSAPAQGSPLHTAMVVWGTVSKSRGRPWANQILEKAGVVDLPEASMQMLASQYPCALPFWLR